MKQLFLPVGLLMAVFAALLFPAGGFFITSHSGIEILIFIIFLVSGYQTGSKKLSLDKGLFTLLALAVCISLFLAPILGLFISKILGLSLPLAMGLIIMSSVPPTISSGVVITEVSNGNTVLALFLTISLNLLGIFTVPYVLNFCLHAVGSIDIDQTALLLKMLVWVLLPFTIGKGVRNISHHQTVSPLWSYLNSGCIILIIYSSMAASKEAFTGLTMNDYLLIVTGAALVHLILLVINNQAGKALKLSRADNNAMLFVTSQKTLSIGLAVLAGISIDSGGAVIVCLIFHFFQIFVDTLLAARLR